MSNPLDPKIRPFCAKLKRMNIGLFTATKEFNDILFENDWKAWWSAEKSEASTYSVIGKTPYEYAEEREVALFNMINRMYAEGPGAVATIGVRILAGCFEWKPNDQHLLAAVNELENLSSNDKAVLKLKVKILAQIEKNAVARKRSTSEVGEHSVSIGVSNKVFIVHGHAEADRLKLVKLLKDEMGLDPIIIQDETSTTLESILNKIERHADECHAAVVLLTPDDETSTGRRPRQNVVMELGYFLGRWRKSDIRRIVVIKKGELEVPSDISGVLYLQYLNEPEELHLKLSKQFRAWGFKL